MTRRMLLRFVYAAALAAYTLYGFWFATVMAPRQLHMMGLDDAAWAAFRSYFWIACVFGYLQVAAPLAVLAVRPMWWGKLLMLMFVAAGLMIWPAARLMSLTGLNVGRDYWPAFATGGALVVLAIIQQIIDPTLWRPVNTWFSGDYPPSGARRKQV